MSTAKTDEPIGVGPRNLTLDGSAHWRHLANWIAISARSMRVGDEVAYHSSYPVN